MNLFELAEKGKLEALESLLKKSASVDSRDREGLTPLMYAALYKRVSIVALLLEKGAAVNAVCNSKWTPLMHAAVGGNSKIAQMLIDAGAKLDLVNDYGRTALMEAAYSGNDAFLKILIKAGANVNVIATNPIGSTALTEALWQGNPDTARILLDNGADILARCRYGESILSWACAHAREDIVANAIKAGADVNDLPEYGSTPLMAAVRGKSETIMRLLIEAGADVIKKDNSGRDVFFYAGAATPGIVEFLLEQSTNPAARASETYMEAIASNNMELLKFLRNRGFILPAEALIRAVQMNSHEIVEFLLSEGLDPDFEDDKNYTALRVASSRGDCKAASSLFKAGADLNAVDQNGNTALHLAAAAGHLDMVLLLISSGADVYEKNSRGTTLLMLAAASGNAELVSLLLSRYSFEINEVDGTDKTALGWSMTNRPNAEVIDLLIKNGARVNVPDGFNPLVYACTHGLYEDRYSKPTKADSDVYYEIIGMLLKAGADPNHKVEGWPLDGASLLQLASETRCPEVVELMKRYGARENP